MKGTKMNDISMSHLMIDIETLGTRSNAVIMSIGAVQFNLKGDTKAVLHRGVTINSCLNAGLEVDGDTIEWWLRQDKKNIEKLLELEKRHLSIVLQELDSIDMHQNGWSVWSHGSVFDIVLLENAYKAVGRKPWWDHRNVRDTRTLFDIAEYKYKAKGGHDALEDATNQAIAVQEAYQKLKGGK